MRSMLTTEFYVILAAPKERGYSWRKLKARRIIQKTDSLPRCDTDEVPLLVKVTLPSALFEAPTLAVNVVVDNDEPRAVIDADTQEILQSRIQEVLGLPTRITIELPESDD